MNWKTDSYWCTAFDVAKNLSSKHKYIVVPDEFVKERLCFWPDEQAKRLDIRSITAFAIPKDRIRSLPVDLLEADVFCDFKCVYANEVFVVFSSLDDDIYIPQEELDKHLESFFQLRIRYLAENNNQSSDDSNKSARIPYILNSSENRLLKSMFPHKNYVAEMFRDLSGEPSAVQKEVFSYCVNQVSLELSGYCNRSCEYCPVKDLPQRKDKSRNMTREILEKCVEGLAEINYKGKICFHLFNEPLYNREFLLDAIKYVREKLPGSYICITTNGDYLTADYLNALIECEISELGISVHYSGNWNYDEQLQKIYQILHRIGLSEKGELEDDSCKILFHVDKTELGASSLDNITLRSEDFNIRGVDRGGALKEAVHIVRNYDHCNCAVEQFNVAWDGSLVPCCGMCSDNQDIKCWTFGNISDYNSIFSAFTSERAAAFRRIMFAPRTEDEYTPEPCRACAVAYMDGEEKLYRIDDDARREIHDCWFSEEDRKSTVHKYQNTGEIEKITEMLKAQINDLGLVSDIPEFMAEDMNQTSVELPCGAKAQHIEASIFSRQLLENSGVKYYRKLTSYVRWLSPVVVFVKRVLRKLVRFILEPAINEINTNRIITAEALQELQEFVQLQAQEIEDLQGELDSLQKKNDKEIYFDFVK